MKWEKIGRIFAPQFRSCHPKLATHASYPLALKIAKGLYRVFHCSRDEMNRSSVAAFDFDLRARRVLSVHHNPLVEYGPPESFYSEGISIGGLYSVNQRIFMLFMGWHRPTGGHWRGEIGRLSVGLDYTLSVDEEEPLIGLNEEDPISVSYPTVIGDVVNGYQMWYGSTITWDAGNGEMLHVIKHATSNNGFDWQRHGLAIPFELGTAQAFSKPTVVVAKNGLHMWYSFRGVGRGYRIGYAFSENGQIWHPRYTDIGIDVSPAGWDSEMIEYPFVFEDEGELFMMYNGNGYGKTGIGLARLQTALW